MEKIVKSHDPTKPLFLYMAFQNVHSPAQAPQQYVDKYKFIKDETRRKYAAMVDILDEAVGNLTMAFKAAGYGMKLREIQDIKLRHLGWLGYKIKPLTVYSVNQMSFLLVKAGLEEWSLGKQRALF